MYCGERCEAIEFIFGVDLPVDNSNLHPRRGPFDPERELESQNIRFNWNVYANFQRSR